MATKTVWRVYANYGAGYGWVPVNWAPIFDTKEQAWAWVLDGREWDSDIDVQDEEVDFMETTDLTEEQWTEQYRPVTNYLTNEGTSYETYGDDLEYVLQQDEKHVWTELDGDNGVYLVNGYHIVNRIQYYITEVPWKEDEFIQIVIMQTVDCDCSGDDGEPNEDCDKCGGHGSYSDWS
jgi:hypothetical protein